MRDCWLKPNRRALLLGCVVPSIAATIGIGIMFVSSPEHSWGIAGLVTGGLLLVVASTIVIGLLAHAMIPRVAFDDGRLLVYLRGHRPYRLPLDVVECFFLGQGPSGMKSRLNQNSRTTNVVIRIAERATEWHDRPVKDSLGEWQNGYVVIRGTWSEPITEGKLRELNSRLTLAKRQLSSATAQKS